MNEMLNSHSHLIIIPRGGLGNRLLAVFSTIRHIVECRFSYATICWLRDIECGIDLEELLCINLPNICIIGEQHIIPKEITLNRLIKKDGTVFLKTCCLFDILGGQLHLNDHHLKWYKSNINMFIDVLINKHVPFDLSVITGVHCRRSDWGLYNTNKEIITDHELLLDRLDRDFASYLKTINTNSFFLATDSIKTLEFFKSKNNILYQDKYHYPPSKMQGKGRDRQIMIESFIDMILLSKCCRIISDSCSTFSLVASILGNINRIIWNRTVLQNSLH